MDTFQAEVDRIPVDDNWKKRLDATWAKYYDDPDFVDIKDCLAAMCPGRMRCCYCEDSAAEGIDHIAPKALFPQSTFAWSNYIYACAVCNKKKSDTWALFVPNGVNRTFTRIPRHRKGHPRKFPTGTDHVFINPEWMTQAVFLNL
ncbi:MAG: HNH endonuclease [Bacteroidetes bacterium]|nr:HNH endonuclease [Bacteroidota bacterium]